MLCPELPTSDNGGAVIEKRDEGNDTATLTYTIQT